MSMFKWKYLLLSSLLLGGIMLRAQQRPNIIMIVSDDHAFQAISAYGSKLMQTPNIDRLAKEGVIFNKAYVTNSICGPSRAVILTGKYSNKNGFRDNETSHFDASQNSFIKELTGVGYQTAWIGKYHLGDKPEGFSYWKILPGQGSYYNPDFLLMDGSHQREQGYVSNLVEDAAEQWLDQRDKSKPFCLVIGHKATHRTWIPDTVDMGRFDSVQFPLPHDFYDNYEGRKAASQQEMTVANHLIMGYDLKMFQSEQAENKDGNIHRMNAAQRAKFDTYYKPILADFEKRNLSGKELAEWKYQRYMRDYLATAASLDRNIGRTLDYIDQHQLTQNTIVIYISDQGFYLGEHGWFDKRWMYEESFRTPMLMRYPQEVKPGTVNNDFVMNLDIAPTLLQAAGVKVPADMQGESFLPLVNGKKAKGRKNMYYHYYENGEHAVSPHFGIRTSRYKLIRYYKRVDGWELFDLKKDPDEMNNLYGKKGYDKITSKLKKQLDALISKYDDTDALQVLQGKSDSTKKAF